MCTFICYLVNFHFLLSFSHFLGAWIHLAFAFHLLTCRSRRKVVYSTCLACILVCVCMFTSVNCCPFKTLLSNTIVHIIHLQVCDTHTVHCLLLFLSHCACVIWTRITCIPPFTTAAHSSFYSLSVTISPFHQSQWINTICQELSHLFSPSTGEYQYELCPDNIYLHQLIHLLPPSPSLLRYLLLLCFIAHFTARNIISPSLFLSPLIVESIHCATIIVTLHSRLIDHSLSHFYYIDSHHSLSLNSYTNELLSDIFSSSE